MYAVIKTGGKQYKVTKGSQIEVELIESPEKTLEFSEILMIDDGQETLVGTPHVSNWRVKGTLNGEVKGEKVVSFKYKRRKNYRRKVGHRQKYSSVTITDIAQV